MTRRSLPKWLLMLTVLAASTMMPAAASAQPQFTHQVESRRNVTTPRRPDVRAYVDTTAVRGRMYRTTRDRFSFSQSVHHSSSRQHRSPWTWGRDNRRR